MSFFDFLTRKTSPAEAGQNLGDAVASLAFSSAEALVEKFPRRHGGRSAVVDLTLEFSAALVRVLGDWSFALLGPSLSIEFSSHLLAHTTLEVDACFEPGERSLSDQEERVEKVSNEIIRRKREYKTVFPDPSSSEALVTEFSQQIARLLGDPNDMIRQAAAAQLFGLAIDQLKLRRVFRRIHT
jgi:hypothetical protein